VYVEIALNILYFVIYHHIKLKLAKYSCKTVQPVFVFVAFIENNNDDDTDNDEKCSSADRHSDDYN